MKELMKLKFKRRATALAAGALLLSMTACVGIPADREVLPQRDLAGAQLSADIKLAREGWPQAQWWTRYDDAQLNALMTQALKDGPSLQVAAARIQSAQAAQDLANGEKGVGFALNANSNRQRYSANGFFPPPIGGSYYTETTPQIVANYEFDWWGKHKSAISAALGEVNASRADYAQAEQTLTAAIAQTYFTRQGDWARLDNLKKIADLQSDMVADKAKRIAHGVASADSERLAEIDLGNVRQQMTMLETQIAQQREALRALVGADADALIDVKPHPLPQAQAELPGRLGFELLARRPDLQAARWHVQASLDRIEETQAAFYPDINLMASFGSDVISLDKLFSAGSRTLYFGPTLTLPIFDSGRLKGRLESARSQRNVLIADYNQSVVNAVREVAQAGVALQGMQKQIDQQTATNTASKAVLRSVQARFDHGLADRASLLSAQLAVDKQQDATLQLQDQQIVISIALIKALGGGYQVDPAANADNGSAAVATGAAQTP